MTADRLAQALERVIKADDAHELTQIDIDWARAELAAYRSQAPAEGDTELPRMLREIGFWDHRGDEVSEACDERYGAGSWAAILAMMESKAQPKGTNYIADLHDTLNQIADALGVERGKPELLIAKAKLAAQSPAPAPALTEMQIDKLLNDLDNVALNFGDDLPGLALNSRGLERSRDVVRAAFASPAVKAEVPVATNIADAFLKCKDEAIKSGAHESYQAVREAFDALQAALVANAAPSAAEALQALDDMLDYSGAFAMSKRRQAEVVRQALCASKPPVQPMGDGNG